jgi:hypothetical protein
MTSKKSKGNGKSNNYGNQQQRRRERYRQHTLVELGGDDGVLDEEFERDDFESVLVGGFEDDRAGGSGALDCEPTLSADTPAVTGFEAVEAVLRHGSGEVVAEGFGDGQERGVDDAANGVHAWVVGAGVAAAVAVEAGRGVSRLATADFEGLAEDVAGGGFDGFDGGHKVVRSQLSVLSCWLLVVGWWLVVC